jgi:hypothetical protein
MHTHIHTHIHTHTHTHTHIHILPSTRSLPPDPSATEQAITHIPQHALAVHLTVHRTHHSCACCCCCCYRCALSRLCCVFRLLVGRIAAVSTTVRTVRFASVWRCAVAISRCQSPHITCAPPTRKYVLSARHQRLLWTHSRCRTHRFCQLRQRPPPRMVRRIQGFSW